MSDISKITLPDGNTYNIKDSSSGYITGMTILSYGSSTWGDFEAAYNANKVVYCRASSNTNPATGAQTRLAFMAYVNAASPTNVEFQYYRSVSSHSDSQQGDQVYVYKLDKTSGWSVTVRENYTKVDTEKGLADTWSSGTIKIKAKLRSETALANDSSAATETANRIYPVALDHSGYLAVNVPWESGSTMLASDIVTGLSADVQSALDPTILSDAESNEITAEEFIAYLTNLDFDYPQVPSPYTSNPSMDGTASAGSSSNYAKGDHVHPSDTSRVPVEVTSGTITTKVRNTGSLINIQYSDDTNEKYGEIKITNQGIVQLYSEDSSSSNTLYVSPSYTGITNLIDPQNNTDAATKKYVDDKSLPTVTSSDNGKVLRVVNGAWAAASLPSANGNSF